MNYKKASIKTFFFLSFLILFISGLYIKGSKIPSNKKVVDRTFGYLTQSLRVWKNLDQIVERKLQEFRVSKDNLSLLLHVSKKLRLIYENQAQDIKYILNSELDNKTKSSFVRAFEFYVSLSEPIINNDYKVDFKKNFESVWDDDEMKCINLYCENLCKTIRFCSIAFVRTDISCHVDPYNRFINIFPNICFHLSPLMGKSGMIRTLIFRSFVNMGNPFHLLDDNPSFYDESDLDILLDKLIISLLNLIDVLLNIKKRSDPHSFFWSSLHAMAKRWTPYTVKIILDLLWALSKMIKDSFVGLFFPRPRLAATKKVSNELQASLEVSFRELNISRSHLDKLSQEKGHYRNFIHQIFSRPKIILTKDTFESVIWIIDFHYSMKALIRVCENNLTNTTFMDPVWDIICTTFCPTLAIHITKISNLISNNIDGYIKNNPGSKDVSKNSENEIKNELAQLLIEKEEGQADYILLQKKYQNLTTDLQSQEEEQESYIDNILPQNEDQNLTISLQSQEKEGDSSPGPQLQESQPGNIPFEEKSETKDSIDSENNSKPSNDLGLPNPSQRAIDISKASFKVRNKFIKNKSSKCPSKISQKFALLQAAQISKAPDEKNKKLSTLTREKITFEGKPCYEQLPIENTANSLNKNENALQDVDFKKEPKKSIEPNNKIQHDFLVTEDNKNKKGLQVPEETKENILEVKQKEDFPQSSISMALEAKDETTLEQVMKISDAAPIEIPRKIIKIDKITRTPGVSNKEKRHLTVSSHKQKKKPLCQPLNVFLFGKKIEEPNYANNDSQTFQSSVLESQKDTQPLESSEPAIRGLCPRINSIDILEKNLKIVKEKVRRKDSLWICIVGFGFYNVRARKYKPIEEKIKSGNKILLTTIVKQLGNPPRSDIGHMESFNPTKDLGIYLPTYITTQCPFEKIYASMEGELDSKEEAFIPDRLFSKKTGVIKIKNNSEESLPKTWFFCQYIQDKGLYLIGLNIYIAPQDYIESRYKVFSEGKIFFGAPHSLSQIQSKTTFESNIESDVSDQVYGFYIEEQNVFTSGCGIWDLEMKVFIPSFIF